MRQPLREMGTAAARLLIGHLAGTPLPDTPTVIPTGFTARDSTTTSDPTAPDSTGAREPAGARVT